GGRRRCHAPSWVQYSPPGRINMLRNATFSGFWRSFHPPSAIGHLSSAIRHLSSAIPPSPFPVPHSAFSRERKKVGGPFRSPMVSLLRKCAEGTVDPAEQLAVRPGLTRGRQGIGEPPVLSVLGSSINSTCPAGV